MPNQIIKKIRLTSLFSKYDLSTWLFFSSLIIYLVTRLIGLTQFPIYFFTDEAIQTLSIADLVDNKYRVDDVLLPTYFKNGLYFNLGLSVYLQWLPYMLFGKSAVVTRITSILVTLIAAFSVGLILRDIFKLKYWWTGPLFLSITPAWFLHSRTAFETVEFVAFYAGALYAYLLYRYRSAHYFYAALFLAACAFYTYSPAQFIVPLTVIALAISDWGYHTENRRTMLRGMVLFFFLGFPYLRFIFYNPHVPFMHLNTLGSYWMVNTPFLEKLGHYFSEYGVGLRPWYWYIPNVRDLPRHLMKDYGHIMLATLPFAVVGLACLLRNLRLPANRIILIVMLASPSAAALTGIGITRSLLFVIPASILTAIGFEVAMRWIIDPHNCLEELRSGSGLNPQRLASGLLILLLGGALASILQLVVDRIVTWSIVILLSVQMSGLDEYLARHAADRMKWNLNKSLKSRHTAVALITFVILSGAHIWMLNDALRNGPTWYTDYGLGGMQYGGFQIFDIIKEYKQEHPDTLVIFSPDWANGANTLAYFFLDEPLPIRITSIRGHLNQKLPLDDSMLFIITPDEYQQVLGNPKFTDLQVDKIVPYPDGNPGFYFVRLRYSDSIDEILASEAATRRILQETNLNLDGQDVKVRHSRLDTNVPEETIALLFDGDPMTMAKTDEANPFIIELTYPSPHTIRGFSVVVGSTTVLITLKGLAYEDAEPVVYTFRGRGTIRSPELIFELPEPMTAQILHLELLNVYATEPAKVHVWEIKFR